MNSIRKLFSGVRDALRPDDPGGAGRDACVCGRGGNRCQHCRPDARRIVASDLIDYDTEIRKWRSEVSLREDKSGPNSPATLYAKGMLHGLLESARLLSRCPQCGELPILLDGDRVVCGNDHDWTPPLAERHGVRGGSGK